MTSVSVKTTYPTKSVYWPTYCHGIHLALHKLVLLCKQFHEFARVNVWVTAVFNVLDDVERYLLTQLAAQVGELTQLADVLIPDVSLKMSY